MPTLCSRRDLARIILVDTAVVAVFSVEYDDVAAEAPVTLRTRNGSTATTKSAMPTKISSQHLAGSVAARLVMTVREGVHSAQENPS